MSPRRRPVNGAEGRIDDLSVQDPRMPRRRRPVNGAEGRIDNLSVQESEDVPAGAGR